MKYLTTLALLLTASLSFAQSPGEIPSNYVSVIPVIAGGAYAAGDVVGTKLVLTSAICGKYSTGYITGVKVDNKTKTAAQWDVILFKADPNGAGTTLTDNNPVDLDDNDLDKVISRVYLDNSPTTDLVNFLDNEVSYKGNLATPIKSDAAGTTIWAALVLRNGNTLVTGDIKLTLAIACDLFKY